MVCSASWGASVLSESSALSDGVTVVVPTFQGHHLIRSALRSLADQTLDRDLMEIVVVPNGKPDGTRALLEDFKTEHPEVTLRVVELKEAGVSLAINAGVFAARRRYYTILDDDDFVSPTFLETLLRHASPDTVPVGRLANVGPDGSTDWDNAINVGLREAAGQRSEALHCHRALAFNTCKLVPTWRARSVAYDLDLRSGSDVVFYMKLFARHPLKVFVCPEDDAVYYRLMRENSVSRRAESYEFSVLERLAVIAALDSLHSQCSPDRLKLLRFLVNSQALFIRRYLDSFPDDHAAVVREVEQAGIRHFPWHLFDTPQEGPTELQPDGGAVPFSLSHAS